MDAQRATGLPESQEEGATLSLNTFAGTQQEQVLARVLDAKHPH